MVAPHKLAKRYTGEPKDVLAKLQEDGHRTDWYRKHSSQERPMTAAKCGYFTVYLLEGEWAYTINNEGQKYMQYRKLKSAQPQKYYYCAACKRRFADWVDAQAHRDGKDITEGQ